MKYKKNTIWDYNGMRHSKDLRSRLLERCFSHGLLERKYKDLKIMEDRPDPVWISNTIGKC